MLGIQRTELHFYPQKANEMDYLGQRCIECGTPISGRSDRKYCCDRCKNKHHNKERDLPWRQYHNRVIRILDCNYEILKRLSDMGIRNIDIAELRVLKFNFEYFTSFTMSGRRKRFTCYEMAYEVSGGRIINICSLLHADLF